jgi:hypothetical protein
MAALLQGIQTLAYKRYASALDAFCALPSGVLNSLLPWSAQELWMAVENIPNGCVAARHSNPRI